MNTKKYLLPVAFITVTFISSSADVAGETTTAADNPEKLTTPTDSGRQLVVYRPPRRGAPATRIGGATRGPDGDVPVVNVLTPEDTGLTLQAQPDLYWHVSDPVNARFEFALITDKGLETVVETKLDAVTAPGIHKIALTDLDVKLEIGVVYQWSVALVQDTEHRSADIIASGTIERVASEGNGNLSYMRNGGIDQVFAYGQAGLWYDAFSLISALINREPSEPELRAQRAALLEQVGLEGVLNPE